MHAPQASLTSALMHVRYGPDVAGVTEQSVIPIVLNVAGTWDHVKHLKVGSVAKHAAVDVAKDFAQDANAPAEDTSSVEEAQESLATRFGQSAAQGVSSMFEMLCKEWEAGARDTSA